MKILLTGGAGFIGHNLARCLHEIGHEVTVLDNLSPQIHANLNKVKAQVQDHARLIQGDVTDIDVWREAIQDNETIIHLAAETGTGQSMYMPSFYNQVNVIGTTNLFEVLQLQPNKVRKVIVASSRSIYGEGEYLCAKCGIVTPAPRTREHIQRFGYELTCNTCGCECKPIATTEKCQSQCASVYAQTKLFQEQTVHLLSRTLGISSIALRLQNVFGPGQSLANPYTGIISIFTNLMFQNQPIQIFEDGFESRDFVYIDDVCEAFALSLSTAVEGNVSINVGSGIPTSVNDLVGYLCGVIDTKSDINTTGEFRDGDIRHCFADLHFAREILQFNPKVSVEQGLRQFIEWALEQEKSQSRYNESLAELKKYGLLK